MKLIFAFSIIMICFASSLSSNNDNVVTFDSIDRCIDMSLKKGDKVGAIRLMNDKCKTLFSHGLYANELLILKEAINLSNDGKDTLKFPEIKLLYMESLNLLGAVYSYIANYEDAIKCYIKMDKYNTGNNVIYKTKFYNGMGVMFSMSEKYDQAKEYYIESLKYIDKIEDIELKQSTAFATNANLGGVFLFKKNYDSSYIYIMEAQKLAVMMKDKSKQLNCLQLLGMLNKSIGKAELAIGYYNDACAIALECGDYFAIPFIKLNISDIHEKAGNYDAALNVAYEALEESRKFKMKKLEMNALKSISRLYKVKGNIDKSLSYLEQSNEIRDSLFNQDNEERFLRQKTDFDMYKIAVEKEISDKNLEIEKGKRIINNLIVFAIIIVLTLMLIYLTRRLIIQEREKRALNEQHNADINIYLDQQKTFESEIEKKNRELFLSSLSIAKNNELTGLLMQKLKILKTNIPIKGKGQDTIQEAEQLVMELRKDSYIGELNECLKHVPDEFYDKLDMRYPDLTTGEKKICALMSFGLSSKDIANMTGKTNGAIGNVKFRIRQKLNVDTSVDLEDFMFHIRES